MNNPNSTDPRAEVQAKLDMHFRDNPEYFRKVTAFVSENYKDHALFLDLLAALSGNKRSFGNYAIFYAEELIKLDPPDRTDVPRGG